jgi:hypothetical protein
MKKSSFLNSTFFCWSTYEWHFGARHKGLNATASTTITSEINLPGDVKLDLPAAFNVSARTKAAMPGSRR